jgi:predicted DsbA family dithiol-disulfide isomerase
LLHITYYTDPLCSWSWAFEPQWRRLRMECGDQIAWRYHMGGMISDWQQYSDPLNDISRPIQMGPQWYEVKAMSGMPLDDRLWYEDPPASSYPSCLAVKAAERQGVLAGERYLRLLREAAMLRRRNIARRDVRVALAHELQAILPSFDPGQFVADLDHPQVLEAFRSDIKEVRYRNISRFPTFILRPAAGAAVLLVGYRPYAALHAAVAALALALVFSPVSGAAEEYLRLWGSATVQEIAEACSWERPAAAAALQAAVTNGAAEQQGDLYLAA